MNNSYGLLLDEKTIKLHRKYFEEMVTLIGIQVQYYSPRPDKTWTTYAEIEGNYYEPETIGCIFNEHPDQRTLKKLGWLSEFSSSSCLISVPYDLKNIQYGALFELPAALDNAKGRLFRVIKLSTTMIYPASITCEIVPEFTDSFSDSSYNNITSSLTLLNEEDSCL